MMIFTKKFAYHQHIHFLHNFDRFIQQYDYKYLQCIHIPGPVEQGGLPGLVPVDFENLGIFYKLSGEKKLKFEEKFKKPSTLQARWNRGDYRD